MYRSLPRCSWWRARRSPHRRRHRPRRIRRPAAAAPASTPAPAPSAAAGCASGRGTPRTTPALPRRHAARQTTSRRPRRTRPGGRGGPPPPPPPPPPAVMPAPVTPIVSATPPSPDPRVGLAAGPLGCGPGGMECSARVDDPARREVPRRDELRPRVHRQVRHSGQLQRLPDLRHLERQPSRRSC